MGLLQMSVSGALMVAAILLVRAAALNRLPKQVFVVLWVLVAARLLVPVDIPLPFSAFNLVDRLVGAAQTITGTRDAASQTGGADAVPGTDPTDAAGTAASDGALPSPAAAPTATPSGGAGSGSPSPSEQASASPSDAAPAQTPGGLPALRAVALVVWLVGATGCGAFFAASYLRCRRDFRMSLPVRDPRVEAWLDRNGAGPLSRRPVEVRQTDLVASPLSYGVAHPVILMPKALGWDDGRVPFVLAHELAHIRRGDQLLKLAFAAAVCIHWFNPFAWAMFVLANRDIELACDERAVRTLGTELRADYARTLLSMAQRRDLPALLYTAFGKNAVEERIGAVMKLRTQRVTAASFIASIALVVGIPAALATSAAEPVPAGQAPAAGADAADGTEATEVDAGDNGPASSIRDAVMREYRAYGLTQIDVPAESAGATAGYVFAFDGQSVRRIYDASLGEVVTDWLDAPVISDDSSVDLVADYDADGLTGLHVAAEGEIEAYQDAYPLMPGNPGLLANGMPVGGTTDVAETPATIEDVLAGYTDAEWGMVTRFIAGQFDVSSTGYRASSVADFRAAVSEAFGTPEGQDLLARLTADENLAEWAQSHASMNTPTPNMNALYVYYALLPLSGDDYEDHAFAGTTVGEQTGAVLDYEVRVTFTDPAAISAVNYALYASQAVYALYNAFYFADEAAASTSAATPETLAESIEARLSSGGVTAYGNEQQVGGLSLEISYTVTGSDGASATRTHTPAAAEGGTGLIVAASGL